MVSESDGNGEGERECGGDERKMLDFFLESKEKAVSSRANSLKLPHGYEDHVPHK